MALALLSKSRNKTQGSVKPVPKRKFARARHSADSRFGFAKPVIQPHITALPTAPVIQPKLKLGEPKDEFEHEADRVAELPENGNGSIAASAAAQRRSPVDNLQRLYGNQPVPQMRNVLAGLPAPSMPLRRSQGGILQRKCACGGAAGMSGKCEECSKKKRLGLQAKLKVNEPGDIYEQEADRIANQVMATPADHTVSGALTRIQRFSGQPTGQTEAAPASVDQALASPGSPLEPGLRQDMEQRFGHDFSRVRTHSGPAAEQSVQDVNAYAYTMGHDIVFGAGRFTPGTQVGRRLIAHELTHVVQQSGADGARARQKNEKRGLSAANSILRKPRIDVIGAAPRVVKAMARDEALAVLEANGYLGKWSDETFAAMDAITATLQMPFTLKNASMRLRLLTAAFNLLDEDGAAHVLKALTGPVGGKQRQLSERFGRLDSAFRSPLLEILHERARRKPIHEAEQGEGRPEDVSLKGTAKWIELGEGVFAFLPSAWMTVDDVAAYVSNNPYMPDALAKLNRVARTAPLPEARPLIVPMEFVDRAEAIQQIPEPVRRRIVYSMRGVPIGPEQYKQIAQVKSVHRGGPGMVGLIPVTAAAVESLKEAVKYAAGFIVGLLEGARNAVVDLFKGSLEMIKTVVEVLYHVITGNLGKIWEMLKDWGEKLKLAWENRGQIFSGFMDKWEAEDVWERGRFQGEVLGWVMMTVLITIVTWGEGAIAQISGKWKVVVDVLKLAQKAGDLGTYVSAAARSLGKVGQAATAWLRASRLAKAVEIVEVAAMPVVWTVESVRTLLQLPERMAQELNAQVVKRLRPLAPYVTRIGKLKENAKRWLFGCHSPCDWNPDVVLEDLKLSDEQINRAGEAFAEHAPATVPSIREGAAPEQAKPSAKPTEAVREAEMPKPKVAEATKPRKPRTPEEEFADFEKWRTEELGATGPLASDALIQMYRYGSRATVAKYLRQYLMKQAAQEGIMTVGNMSVRVKPGVPLEKQVNAFVASLEGAHTTPQAFGKKLPKDVQEVLPGGKYNPEDALVILTEKLTHTAMDQPWKDAFNTILKGGAKEATAQEVFDSVANGIRKTPGMSASEKASRIARLQDEMFIELELVPNRKYDIPRIYYWWEIVALKAKKKK
jgi:hypothetical protein